MTRSITMDGTITGEPVAFQIPGTPLVRVSYVRDGVRYDAVIPNPKTNARLQTVMLARQVSMSQVQYVAAMQERRQA